MSFFRPNALGGRAWYLLAIGLCLLVVGVWITLHARAERDAWRIGNVLIRKTAGDIVVVRNKYPREILSAFAEEDEEQIRAMERMINEVPETTLSVLKSEIGAVTEIDFQCVVEPKMLEALVLRKKPRRLQLSRLLLARETSLLRRRTWLTQLKLHEMDIMRSDWSFLASLDQLQYLAITKYSPSVSHREDDAASFHDADTRYLRNMKSLKSLSLSTCEVGDSLFEAISDAKELEEIHLYHCQVTDSGIASLAKFPKLRDVSVFRWYPPSITDAGLLRFAEMPQLKKLGIQSPLLTPAGIAAAFERLPASCDAEINDQKRPAVQ